MAGQELDDPRRLLAIAAADLLDTPPEESFDRATRLATRFLGTPVSLVSIVTEDRQFFKSQIGLSDPWATARETPLTHSFCQHVVTSGTPLVVTDAREHDLVRDNPAISDLDVVAYCGVPITDDEGNVLGSFCAIDDQPRAWSDEDVDTLRLIGETLRTELLLRVQTQELHASNESLSKLSRVASSTQNMVIITDAAGETEWVNTAFEEFTGYGLEELVGRRPGEVLQGPDSDPETIRHMAAALARGEGFNVEIVNYTRAGEPYWVAIDVQPVLDDDGDVATFVAVQSDVTERHSHERDLSRARDVAEELAREKATFLASMSHEIRTPLNGIIGLTGMLLDTDLDSLQREYVTTARGNGELLLEVLNNVLDFSALESDSVDVERRPFDIRRLVADTCDLFRDQATARELVLRASVADDVHEAFVGDPTRLRQVLANLLANALKFTVSGGVTLGVTRDGDDIRFAVTDTGIGIASDRLHRLFQPFSQAEASTFRKFGGTGLGLVISERLVRLMGGELRVSTMLGVGTTFSFSLPLQVADASTDPAPSAVNSPTARDDLAPLRLLLAEDDPVNQIVAVHMLEKMGHAVTVVDNGRRALDALAEAEFDVVLMDVHMPEMDGLETTRHILDGWSASTRPRIMAMTANALDGDRERFLAAGMDGYVSKPVSAQALAQALVDVMAAPVGSDHRSPDSSIGR